MIVLMQAVNMFKDKIDRYLMIVLMQAVNMFKDKIDRYLIRVGYT